MSKLTAKDLSLVDETSWLSRTCDPNGDRHWQFEASETFQNSVKLLGCDCRQVTPVIPDMDQLHLYLTSATQCLDDADFDLSKLSSVGGSAGDNIPVELFTAAGYQYLAFTIKNLDGIVWGINPEIFDEDLDDKSFELRLVMRYMRVSRQALNLFAGVASTMQAKTSIAENQVSNQRRIAIAEKASISKEVLSLRRENAALRDVAESNKAIADYEKAKSVVLQRQVDVLTAAVKQYGQESWSEDNARTLAFDGPSGWEPAEGALKHAIMDV